MNYTINAMRQGNMVNLSLNGKLFKKTFATAIEADELMRLCITAKSNPTPENIKAIKMTLNEKTRIALKCGLENDIDTGEIYLAGFNVPVPDTLVQIMVDYYNNGYPMKAIENFWKLLMINPDTRVRKSLFDFILTHDFVLTDSGYFIAYKAVIKNKKQEHNSPNNPLKEFVTEQYEKIKRHKKSPAKFYVYRNLKTVDEFKVTKDINYLNWDEKGLGIQFMGSVSELYDDVQNVLPHIDTVDSYTDKHSKSMHIQLGVPVKQKRSICDANPEVECSVGVHCGSTRYVEQFASRGDSILVCYVNPANVVAVPSHDHSKIRVCEYYPFAEAEYENGKINIIKESYYEVDYKKYEEDTLNEMVSKLQENQPPIEKAINAPDDEPMPMSEMLKIIENRLLTLSVE